MLHFAKFALQTMRILYNMPPLCQNALLNSLTLILTGSTMNSGRL